MRWLSLTRFTHNLYENVQEQDTPILLFSVFLSVAQHGYGLLFLLAVLCLLNIAGEDYMALAGWHHVKQMICRIYETA